MLLSLSRCYAGLWGLGCVAVEVAGEIPCCYVGLYFFFFFFQEKGYGIIGDLFFLKVVSSLGLKLTTQEALRRQVSSSLPTPVNS